MAGARTPEVQKAIRGFRDLGLALRGVVTQFKAITAPLNGMVQAFQRLAQTADLSLSTGASMKALQKYGAALRAFGGDVKNIGSLFGKLDNAFAELKMGRSTALTDELARNFNLIFTGYENEEQKLAKLRHAMATLPEWKQRALQKQLGMTDDVFRLVTASASEFNEIVEKGSKYRLDSQDETEATKNSLALRRALGYLSQAWESLKLQLGNCFSFMIPVIERLADLLIWVAKNKYALYTLATIIGILVTGNLIRFIGGLMRLAKAFRAIPSVTNAAMKSTNLFGRVAEKVGKWSETAAPRISSAWGKVSPKIMGALRTIGNVFRHPIQSAQKLIQMAQRLLNALNEIVKVKVGAKLAQGFRAVLGWINTAKNAIGRAWQSIANGFGRVWGGIKGLVGGGKVTRFFASISTNAAKLWKAISGGIRGIMGLFRGLGGILKGVFGGLIGVFLFAINGVTFAFTQFKKYIWDNLSDFASFFTETIPQMFSSFGDFFSILGGMWSGFFEGLGDGLTDAFHNLLDFFTLGFLSEDSLGKVTDWFMSPFRSIADGIAHPIDTILGAWDGMLGSVTGAWKKARKWLPSWLGGYSDEEKKQMEEDEKNGKKTAKVSTGRGFGGEEYDIVSKGSEAYRAAFQEAKMNGDDEKAQRLSAAWDSRIRDIGQTKRIMRGQGYSESAISDAVNNMYGAMSVAGKNLKDVNRAAAGASSMMQTTNDNRSSVNNNASNTSVKVDGITINAKTDNPEKLGKEIMSQLNSYTTNGLAASSSLLMI